MVASRTPQDVLIVYPQSGEKTIPPAKILYVIFLKNLLTKRQKYVKRAFLLFYHALAVLSPYFDYYVRTALLNAGLGFICSVSVGFSCCSTEVAS